MGNQQANGQGAPLGSAPPRPTSAQEEAERQQRANALQNRIEKKQPKKKSVQEIKAEHWKAYKSIDGSTAATAGHANPPSTSSTGYRLADGARVSSNSSSPTNADSQYQPPAMRSAASMPTTSTSTSTSSSTSTSQPTLKSSSSSSVLAQPAHPLEARAQARVFKKKDDPSSKWKTYEQLDALSQQQATSQQSHIERHAQEITSSESDRKYVSVREAQAAGVLPTTTPTTTPSLQQTDMDPHFKMQMESLLQQAQTMPIASLDLIRKMLGNLNKPSPDDKFRRVKLSNDKIQQSIVNVPGAIELLLAVGFEVDALMLPSPTSTDIIEEDYLVWRDTHQNQSVVAIAIQQLDQLLASRKS